MFSPWPEGRMDLRIVCRVAEAGYVAAGVDRTAVAVVAAEGAEVDHPTASRPQEGVRSAVAGEPGGAGHLTLVIDRARAAERAAKRAEVGHRGRACSRRTDQNKEH